MMPFRLTPAVKVIAIVCVVAFIIQQTSDQFLGGNVTGFLGLVPSGFMTQHRFWQIFTYAFLHGDPMHLFLNLLMLVFIGAEIEGAWGTARFLRFYFFCSVSAGVLYLLLQVFVWGGLSIPMVGASGAIYGLLMAYGLIFGERVLLFMMLFPMKAKHFVWILAGVEFMTTVYSARGGLASAAHLGGMAAGFAYLWGRAFWIVARRRKQEGRDIFGRKPKDRSKKRKSASHLKLVVGSKKDDDSDDDINKNPTWH